MTTDVEDFQDMEPSTISETPDVAAQAAADAAPVTPTPDVAQEKDTLSIVRDVVSKAAPADAVSSTDEEEEVEEQGATADDKSDEYADVPFGKHPRFQQLLRERNGYKERAQYSDNIQNFLDSNGLESEEAATGIKIMALAKVDPVKAWDAIKPWVTQLATAAGEIMPADILERVAKGEISVETGKELSKARATSEAATNANSFREQQAARSQATTHVQQLKGAADEWAANRFAKDPNFPTKVVELQKEVLYLQSQEGKPNTVEGVRDQLKRAYQSVNAKITAAPPPPRAAAVPPAAPRKPATQPIVRGGQVSTSSVAPAVETTLDVIRRVQQKHGIHSTAG
jgi:hypothetical protein